MDQPQTERSTVNASTYLRERSARILLDWERAARALAPAEAIPTELLRSGVGELVGAVAAALRCHGRDRCRERLTKVGEHHALLSMQQGFDLATVVSAVTLLRERALADSRGPGAKATVPAALDSAFGRVLVAIVARYAEVQTRVLRAMDHVTSLSLQSSTLDELLHAFTTALVEELPSVACASIHLMEDGAVRMRASIGTEEGRTLYAVPMMRGSTLVGLARVGSESAEALSQRDRELFDSMVSRVTAAVQQQMFREAAEKRAEELAESERRLRRVESRLRLAMEVAEVEAWDWKLETGEVIASDRARAMLGFPPDEPLTARRLLDLLPPGERREHLEAWRRAMNPEDGTLARDHRIVRPSDGRERWISVRARLWFDDAGATRSVLGTVLDITEQKRAEERTRILADVSERLASSLDYHETMGGVAQLMTPRLADACAIDILRPDGTLGDFVGVAPGTMDPATVRALRTVRRRQLPRADARRGIMGVIQRGEPELLEEIDDAFYDEVAQEPQQAELFRSLGLESILIVPIGRGGRTFGAITLAYAGSGRRFGREDVPFVRQIADRAAVAIDNARLHEQTAHVSELRERLISVLSHDLRTPLTAIHLASALLTETLEDRPVELRQAQIVQRNAARIRRLIDDLLDLTNIQAGRLGLELRASRIEELLRRLTSGVRPRAAKAGVELRTELTLGEATVRCDRARLRDALRRILSFAIDCADAGDVVTLEADRGPGRVSIVISGGSLDLDVDPEELFELYWKAKSAGDRARGLGLFIARGVVEAHRGRVWVEEGGLDTVRIVVSLPLDDDGARAERPQPSGGPKTQKSG